MLANKLKKFSQKMQTYHDVWTITKNYKNVVNEQGFTSDWKMKAKKWEECEMKRTTSKTQQR